MKNYATRIAEIGEELKTKTPGDMEADLSRYNYTGVGFGYNFKDSYPKTREEAFRDIAVPEFEELVRIASEL
jgi:hypothetical protein